MLTQDMQDLITRHTAGMVASINDDGTPSVSPKATFVVLGETALAYGNIRSPGTSANIRQRPSVEIAFLDPVLRKSVRVSGNATVIRKVDADDALIKAFKPAWADYIPRMSSFVKIDVTAAELILSPAYDIGITEDELRTSNLARLNAL